MEAGMLARRSVRRFAALLILALAASACVSAGEGGSDTQASGERVKPRVAKDPTEPVTITFSSWITGSPLYKKLKEQFEAEHPNITVEYQLVPSGRARDKLLTQVAGGNPPDVAFMDAGAVEDFATRGALLDITPYIAGSDVVSADDYVDGFRSAVEIDGRMYGLPYGGETTGLFYRTDLFEQAGIDAPPETWEELEATAAKLTNPAEKTYGWIMFAPEAYYYWYPFLWGAGGEVLSPDGQEITFDSPEAIESAEFFIGLRKYSPPDYYNSDSWNGRVAFATGKVAMYMAGSWFGGEMQLSFPQINGKWDVAPLPEGPEGCATHLTGDSLAVLEQSDNPDAAFLWAEFLSRPENLKAYTYGSKTASLLPSRESLLDDPELGKFNPWLRGFADNMRCAVTSNIDQPKWAQVEQGPLLESMGEAVYGDVSPEEALEQAAQEGEEILGSSTQ
jgi:multiple sugar transport system substrate-binding protein